MPFKSDAQRRWYFANIAAKGPTALSRKHKAENIARAIGLPQALVEASHLPDGVQRKRPEWVDKWVKRGSSGLPDAPDEYKRSAPAGTMPKMSGGRVVYVPKYFPPLRKRR